MPVEKLSASEIVAYLLRHDPFSAWLGIEVMESRAGHCRLRMRIRPEMCNGFNIAHGGIAFSVADSALAFASNSRGRHALSVETSISHIKKLKAWETITATAEEKHHGNHISLYEVTIRNEQDEPVAFFKGTVYRLDEEWISKPE
jgi:acyl-CoA thioesterase